MIYTQCDNLRIRDMESRDAEPLAASERAQGWIHAAADKYHRHIADRDAGLCVALTAELEGEPVGYLFVYWNPENGPFAGQGIPELVDFGVLEKVRRRGVGTKLMDVAERLAATRSDTVSLGVGLHFGYGPAQRMYVLRGYVPDGSGVWYQNRIWPQYEPFVNDDDVVLHMSKPARCREE